MLIKMPMCCVKKSLFSAQLTDIYSSVQIVHVRITFSEFISLYSVKITNPKLSIL